MFGKMRKFAKILIFLVLLNIIIVLPSYYSLETFKLYKEVITTVLTANLIGITALYVILTREQVSLIERERKANLIVSTVKPRIEEWKRRLKGNISKLELKSAEVYFELLKEGSKSYTFEGNTINILDLTGVRIESYKDWSKRRKLIFDYSVMAHQNIKEILEEIDSNIERMRELLEKVKIFENTSPDFLNSIVERFKELSVYNIYKKKEQLPVGRLVDLVDFIVKYAVLKLIEDTPEVRLMYENLLRKDINEGYFKEIDIEEDLRKLRCIMGEVLEEMIIDAETREILNKIKEIKNGLLKLSEEAKDKLNELLSTWRAEYDIPDPLPENKPIVL